MIAQGIAALNAAHDADPGLDVEDLGEDIAEDLGDRW